MPEIFANFYRRRFQFIAFPQGFRISPNVFGSISLWGQQFREEWPLKQFCLAENYAFRCRGQA